MTSEKREQTAVERASRVLLSMQRFSWEQGVAAQAFLELGDMHTATLLAREAVQRQGADGRLAIMRQGESITDPAANGEALLQAARLTGDAYLKIAAQKMLVYLLEDAPRAPDGTLYHTIAAPEIWVDSLYMAPPFLAVAGETGEALQQVRGIQKRLWQADHKLYAHTWDEAEGALKRADHWGVGNGWAAAGLLRVIQALPDEMETERESLAGHVQELLEGCLAHQCPDGLFHNLVDQPDTFVETNLAQILAYTIYRSLAGGWLPAAYRERADRMRAAVHNKVDEAGYVRGVCGAPGFDHPGTAPEGQAFFMLMEAAWRDLEHH
jgi:rhamnogalacturonyl hydrolase YesR